MKAMLGRMERYLGKKRLELNTEKTKVMRFKRGENRIKKMNWTWKGKRLEEFKEYKYL